MDKIKLLKELFFIILSMGEQVFWLCIAVAIIYLYAQIINDLFVLRVIVISSVLWILSNWFNKWGIFRNML